MLTFAAYDSAAVAPRSSYSRTAFRLLGVDVQRLEDAAATPLRAGIAWALAGVRTDPTELHPEGVSRGALVRACGRQHAFKVGEAFALQPVCCRQRVCPACARARARDNAATLERAMDARRNAARCMFLFATFTQPKKPRHLESPREATARIRDTWRRLVNGTATREAFASRFAGGLRTTEVTYAERGDMQRNGGRSVAFSGYHAHLHVLIEVRAGVDPSAAAGWILRAWLEGAERRENATCGVARKNGGYAAAAQCVKRATIKDAQELCKYVTKPLESVADSPAILRELFAGLHGLRLLQAFGEWQGREGVRKGWRELGESDEEVAPPGARYRGPEIGELLRNTIARHRPEGTTDRVQFLGVRPGDEITVSATEAWDAIQAAITARVRDSPAGVSLKARKTASPQRSAGARASPARAG